MKEYHKIQTVFKRDPDTNFKTLLGGQYSMPEFEYLKDNTWEWTEKVDGTNIRIMWDGNNLQYGGKTGQAQLQVTLLKRLQERFESEIEYFRAIWPDGVCLYGEGYGAKIQKVGHLYRKDQDFVLFDVLSKDWWLQRNDVERVASALKIDCVPVCGEGTLDDMVKLAFHGIKSTWGDFQAEGYVARPKTELKTRGGKRIITKIKCKDFRNGQSS